MFSTTCPSCQGAGQRVLDPCEECSGQGVVVKKRKVLVSLPAGIDSGQRLRVPGQGMAGPPGTPTGDLYVDVEGEPDPRFSRDGYDLLVRKDVSYRTAVLGGEVDVELPDGSAVEATIKPGTQPGSVVTVPNRGIPPIDRHGRGALHIVLNVRVPKRVSRKVRKLLEELDRELEPDSSRWAAG